MKNIIRILVAATCIMAFCGSCKRTVVTKFYIQNKSAHTLDLVGIKWEYYQIQVDDYLIAWQSDIDKKEVPIVGGKVDINVIKIAIAGPNQLGILCKKDVTDINNWEKLSPNKETVEYWFRVYNSDFD